MQISNGTTPPTERIHIVAIPFPGRGHINPMLSLCHHLARTSFSNCSVLITVVVTEEWLGLLSSTELESNVRLQTIPNVIPSEAMRGAHYEAFIMAVMTKMASPVDEVVEGMDVGVDAILADSTLPWAPQIGRKRGLPVAALFPQSATLFLALHLLSTNTAAAAAAAAAAAGLDDNNQPMSVEEISKWLEYLPRSSSPHLDFEDFKTISTTEDTILQAFTKAISWFTTAHSLLFTSFFELETRAIHALKSKLSLPIYTVGPSILHMTTTHHLNNFPYSNWLDLQPPTSILYVSLGSFLPISTKQMDEIVTGLHMSKVRFLLVVREDSARMQELCGELGCVVPWSHQLQTLCHPSVGGFLTHCGWNSTMEGAYAGLPMLTFPLMWDQFPNSKLVVDEWKVGWRLKGSSEEGNFIGGDEIAKIVNKLMDLDDEESKEMRRRAKELKEMCGLAFEEKKGSSSICIDEFVQDIHELKVKNNAQI